MTAHTRFLTTIAAALLAAASAAGQTIRVDMGTLAPEGSPWHLELARMAQDWKRLSGGRVKVTIYPGGSRGDEVEMLRRMRTGEMQAIASSGIGLSKADRSVDCLQIPMMFSSYEELDHVREQMEPKLEGKLAEKGFVVLNWGDVGWVYFFTKKPARTLPEIRKMKLFIAAGDPEVERLYKEFGFQPKQLAPGDMLTSLQTGLIDAFDAPPLFAMLDQSFGVAKYMIDLKWAPLIGATLIDQRTWDRIPEPLRPALMKSAREAGERLRGEVRKLGDDAIAEMQKRDLRVIRLDDATFGAWRTEVEAAWSKLRGRLVAADLFDEVRRLRDEYRSRRSRR